MRSIAINKIVLFGDSQTEQSSSQAGGFNLAPALQHEYWSKLQVITHGYGGYNTEHGRHIINAILEAEAPAPTQTSRPRCPKIELLVIFFGTNDAADPKHNTLSQCVSIDRYKENLSYMVKVAKGRGVEAVVLVGPAPVNELAPEAPLDRSTERARQYSDAAAQVAGKFGKRNNVTFVDLWQAFMDSAGWTEEQPIPGQKIRVAGGECDGAVQSSYPSRALATSGALAGLLASDGVHFTAKGYRIWYDLLRHTIREQWPALRSENLKTIFPHILDIDTNNLPASLWQHLED
ncbi:uncharacterized protein Z519_01278 [Cladophialophora bantiana CBS 173.52]|uniref:SGNH hydrolase-type esterase domain-containing protein n=1 Tax=Cladophialophora bantiana (strain ATCC 10958 / CBS 173.52 / CDC B-1940 / NIH 8579) TaxID=1442370 RepID=A0A0D2ILL8_CLAB1|nr:uncharacterized protein Z519_01278 [Cladophialophora bantiana CBS 173.52]KIW97694.1 hypothetical protein Z519_01278 [Cladophialophora bantiana CBS 173.52]